MKDWLRFWGQIDAHHVGGSGDMGVDVESSDYVVQVKAMMANVGRPVIQQTFGVAAHHRKQALVFSLGGFTDEALEWANGAGVGLFGFDLQGEPEPVNRTAMQIAVSRSSDDGPESRVAVADSDEALGWFHNHQAKFTSEMTNVLLVGEASMADDVITGLTAIFDNVVTMESNGFFTVDHEDVTKALVSAPQMGLLVIDEIERIDSSKTAEILVQAVTRSQMGVVLGSGIDKQKIVIDLPEFSLIGFTSEPGKVDRRLLEVFDLWLIQ